MYDTPPAEAATSSLEAFKVGVPTLETSKPRDEQRGKFRSLTMPTRQIVGAVGNIRETA